MVPSMIEIFNEIWKMSNPIRKFNESYIEFDLSSADRVHPHDTLGSKGNGECEPDGNTSWPGVDFRIKSSKWVDMAGSQILEETIRDL